MFITKTGNIFFIEFKKKDGSIREIQKFIINKLETYKVKVFVIDSIATGKEVINIMNTL